MGALPFCLRWPPREMAGRAVRRASALGLISNVVAVSQSAEKIRLPRTSVGWCTPRYIRPVATSIGMASRGQEQPPPPAAGVTEDQDRDAA